MVHKRPKMELIKNEKARLLTFKKRKTSLLKKLKEFSILCGVDGCIIIFEPKQNAEPAKFETWPSNPNEFTRIIKRYKKSDQPRRSYYVYDYFAHKKKKVDAETAKLQQQNYKAKYTPWHEDLNNIFEDQLRLLVGQLDAKIEFAYKKLDMLKKIQDLADKAASSMQASSQLGQNTPHNIENIGRRQNNMQFANLVHVYDPKPLDIQLPSYYYPQQSSYTSLLNANQVKRDFINNVCATSLQLYSDPRQLNVGMPVNFEAKHSSHRIPLDPNPMVDLTMMDLLNNLNYPDSSNLFGASTSTSSQCVPHGGLSYINPGSMRNNRMFNNANPHTSYSAPTVQHILPNMQFPKSSMPVQTSPSEVQVQDFFEEKKKNPK